MTEELKTIETVDTSPFRKMVMTIGELPTSFVDSMTYYELLAWLCNYLQNTVIPTVNNNAEAVEELQGLFIELKTFVDEYFDNLDVQEEINNKLDQMADDGTLQEIIGSYLNATAVWGFDTVADMKASTNLINGSFARTLGFRSKTDNGGAIYKIRNITNDDVVDEMTIIEIGDSSNQLIAELILSDTISPEMLGAYGDGTHDDTVAIQKAINIGNIIFLDKSYLTTSTIRIGDNDNIDIRGDKSTITYTGDSYAFLIQHINGGKASFGTIDARTAGGCIKLESSAGTSDRVQYFHLNFNCLRANTRCIYGHVTNTGWVSEITINGGYMRNGTYGIYLENAGSQVETSINAWHFYNIGFEGTDNNIYISSTSSTQQEGHYFENCRYVENSTANLMTSVGRLRRTKFVGWGGLDEARLNLQYSQLYNVEFECPIYETGTTTVKANGIYYNLGKKRYIHKSSTWNLPTKTSNVTSGTIRFSQEGNVCIIRVYGLVVNAAQGNLIDSLPFAPVEETSNCIFNTTGSKAIRIYATTAGALKYNMPSANVDSTEYFGELVFFTDSNITAS